MWSSTCFGRHTAHHQEPKTALAAFGFAYVEGCWTCRCWTLSGRLWAHLHTLPDSFQQPHIQQPSTYAKPEAASAVLGSWWWAVCRPKHVEFHIIIKKNVWYFVVSWWIYYMNYTVMHRSTNIKFTMYLSDIAGLLFYKMQLDIYVQFKLLIILKSYLCQTTPVRLL